MSDTSEVDEPADGVDAEPDAESRQESQEQPVAGSKLVEGTDDDVEFAN